MQKAFPLYFLVLYRRSVLTIHSTSSGLLASFPTFNKSLTSLDPELHIAVAIVADNTSFILYVLARRCFAI